jgi:DNA-3-methyladenine glycosylase
MFPDFLNRSSVEVARLLLGCYLVREIDGQRIVVRIVETESYDMHDVASHSYKGETARNGIMFGQSGYLYVYFTYGMHYCCNVVTGEPGEGSAVLIRAVEPVENKEYIEEKRHKKGVETTNGPAKLCQALAINLHMNGHDLRTTPLMLYVGDAVSDKDVVTTTRIGISKARDELRRFYIKDSPYVSVFAR